MTAVPAELLFRKNSWPKPIPVTGFTVNVMLALPAVLALLNVNSEPSVAFPKVTVLTRNVGANEELLTMPAPVMVMAVSTNCEGLVSENVDAGAPAVNVIPPTEMMPSDETTLIDVVAPLLLNVAVPLGAPGPGDQLAPESQLLLAVVAVQVPSCARAGERIRKLNASIIVKTQ